MHGFINIYKPAGITSRKAVNQITKTLRPVSKKIKVGHTGTLDPMATGVLVIGIGKATSLIRWMLQGDKKYLGTFLLGLSSSSEDTETETQSHPIPATVNQAELQQTLKLFQGKISQVPPAFSALRVNGKRAYQLARKGEQVELKPREIEIFDLQLKNYSQSAHSFQINVHCSGGTYIRSLGRDIARKLGTQAVMSELERTAAGSFCLDSSVPLDKLDSVQSVQNALQPCSLALTSLPKIQINQVDRDCFSDGLVTYQLTDQLFHFWNLEENSNEGLEVEKRETVLVDQDGQPLGVVEFRQHSDRSKRWKTVVNLVGKG